MRFRDRACAHLARYRETVMAIPEEGVFVYRGNEYRKGHILPRDLSRRNILEPYCDRFFSSRYSAITLHRYFHHLNSSQALCINLFFPLLLENRTDLVVSILGGSLEPPVDAAFEAESQREFASRRTSFDLRLANALGHEVLVEVKYTEDGFGRAKNDEEHCAKFESTYRPFVERSPFLAAVCKDRKFFLQNYQIMRNLAHIDELSDVVFLFPRGNDVVLRQANDARRTFLTKKGREKLRFVFLEDVVAHLKVLCAGGNLDGYYQGFEDKYVRFSQ